MSSRTTLSAVRFLQFFFLFFRQLRSDTYVGTYPVAEKKRLSAWPKLSQRPTPSSISSGRRGRWVGVRGGGRRASSAQATRARRPRTQRLCEPQRRRGRAEPRVQNGDSTRRRICSSFCLTDKTVQDSKTSLLLRGRYRRRRGECREERRRGGRERRPIP